MVRTLYKILLWAFWWPLYLYPQNELQLLVQKTTEVVVLDGKLNEPCWQNTDSTITPFWQIFPYDTSYALSQTTVKVLFDEKNLYIAAICRESIQKQFVVQSLRRDFGDNNDFFEVFLDPFKDQTNGFSFAVTPMGSQREALLINGGNWSRQVEWDNKWYAETHRDTNFWSVEIAIPFKTLRYRTDITTWGINFARQDLKRNEISVWTHIPRNFNTTSLIYTGKLIWKDSLPKPGRNLSLIPYLASSMNQVPSNPVNSKISAGLDSKYGVTPSLNLDLTINPDFSQVDVDQQQINLTRFSLFFPEKRTFFLENSDIFAQFGFSKIRPFFSRKIGLKDGRLIPIIAGARLTGKINQNWRTGLMTILTKDFEEDLLENFTITAVQRRIWGASNFGAVFVNRQNLKQPQLFNRVAGIDFNLLSKNNRWRGKGFFHHSFSSNQPKDAFAHASFLMYSDKKLFVMWNHEYVNKNYDAQTGFTPRIFNYEAQTGILHRFTYWRLEPEFHYFSYPKSKYINSIAYGIYADIYYDSTISVNDAWFNPQLSINFQNSASLNFNANYQYTNLYFLTYFSASKEGELRPGWYNYNSYSVSYTSNPRKVGSYNIEISAGDFFASRQYRIALYGSVRVQPYFNITPQIELNYFRFPSGYSEQITLLGIRTEFTFNRKFFLTVFAQRNSQNDYFNTNVRFQWRFLPMSDLFIVYSDTYSISWLPKQRTLTAKLVWWLGL
ncbi:MAG: carbohydrate binding family 9 domain-containing protein [Bacteroidia bacterium]|nr:carbohydrate binding family 9 domain-containing protein [Bacteroidia bacterium]